MGRKYEHDGRLRRIWFSNLACFACRPCTLGSLPFEENPKIRGARVHTLNLESVRSSGAMPLGTAVYGLVSISAITWVTTYVMIGLYNRWAK